MEQIYELPQLVKNPENNNYEYPVEYVDKTFLFKSNGIEQYIYFELTTNHVYPKKMFDDVINELHMLNDSENNSFELFETYKIELNENYNNLKSEIDNLRKNLTESINEMLKMKHNDISDKPVLIQEDNSKLGNKLEKFQSKVNERLVKLENKVINFKENSDKINPVDIMFMMKYGNCTSDDIKKLKDECII